MATAAKIEILLDAQTAKLTSAIDGAASGTSRAVDRMRKSWAQVALGMNAVFGIAGKLAGQFSKLGEITRERLQLDQMSKDLGITTTRLRGLSRAANQFGADGDDLVALLREMNLRIGEAALTGTGSAADALQVIGLRAKELNSLAVPQQMAKLQDAINKISDPSQRRFLRDELFGGDAEKFNLLLSQTSESIAQITSQVRAFGAEVDPEKLRKFTDQQAQLKAISDDLTIAIGGPLIDAVASYQDSATSLVTAVLDSWINKNRTINEGLELQRSKVEALQRPLAKMQDIGPLLGPNQGGLIEDFGSVGQKKAVDTGKAYQEEVAKGISSAFSMIDSGAQYEAANRIGNLVSDALSFVTEPLAAGIDAAMQPTLQAIATLLPGGATAGAGALSVINRSGQRDRSERQKQAVEQLQAQKATTAAITTSFEQIKSFAGF